MKTIPIRCDVKLLIPLNEIQPFQGNLKELREGEFKKLKSSLLEHGYTFPCLVWRHCDTGKWMTIDAHQRNMVCKLLMQEGYTIAGGDRVPCVEIMADSEKDAKRKILLAASSYARVTDEGLYEFISEAHLDFDDVKLDIDLPGIDMDKFEAGYIGDKEHESAGDGGDGGDGGDAHTCPKCGHTWSD